MKSTGEVMGIDIDAGIAFLKSQVAAGNTIPADGNVFISVRDSDKPSVLPLARQLAQMGFDIYATRGTSTMLRRNGIASRALFRISEGNPNVLDMIDEKEMAWIINTPSVGHEPRADEQRMRSHAVVRGIPITTTVDGARTAIHGLEVMAKLKTMEVCSLQEYSRHAPDIRLPRAEGRQ
jgi:carbamoyl-phosphate synthase large subunit